MSVAGFAQQEVGTFTIQPKVGLNIANLAKTDGDPRFGVAVGAELEYQLTDIFSLSAGALYSMQGNKTTGTALGSTATLTQKLDYVNIPVLANVYVVRGLAVKVGVQPAFKVSSKLSGSVTTPLGGGSDATDINANTFDLSIPVGVSYELANFVLDARYNFGVTKIRENMDPTNSVFQITLGYKFAL